MPLVTVFTLESPDKLFSPRVLLGDRVSRHLSSNAFEMCIRWSGFACGTRTMDLGHILGMAQVTS